MRDWFANAFGRTADAIGDGLGDVRDKLVFEGFFQRHVPERSGQNDLGWFQDQPTASLHDDRSVLDRFYDRLSPAERAEHFLEPPEQHQGIER